MVLSSLGSTSTTAQVTPALLTEALLEETPSVRILKASPTELVHSSSSGRLRAVRYSGKGIVNGQSGVLEGVTEFVFANGPWVGGLAKGLLGEEVGGRLDVNGEKANSIVVRLGEEGRRSVGARTSLPPFRSLSLVLSLGRQSKGTKKLTHLPITPFGFTPKRRPLHPLNLPRLVNFRPRSLPPTRRIGLPLRFNLLRPPPHPRL